jgi:hypothetical protein
MGVVKSIFENRCGTSYPQNERLYTWGIIWWYLGCMQWLLLEARCSGCVFWNSLYVCVFCMTLIQCYYMVLLCQWLCHLCGELWYHTRAEGFTYVSFTHTHSV